MPQDAPFNPYTVDREAGGEDIIVMCNGKEIGTAPDLGQAALMAADDAIRGYPEYTLDVLNRVADGMDRKLPSAIGGREFRMRLASVLAKEWRLPSMVSSPRM